MSGIAEAPSSVMKIKRWLLAAILSTSVFVRARVGMLHERVVMIRVMDKVGVGVVMWATVRIKVRGTVIVIVSVMVMVAVGYRVMVWDMVMVWVMVMIVIMGVACVRASSWGLD